MPHPHVNLLKLFLAIAAITLLACVWLIIVGNANIGLIVGHVLVLVMTVGFFYATLHLSKLK